MLIFGANAIGEALKLCEDLGLINGEQMSDLRSVAREQARLAYENEEKGHAIYHEIARLNNELINMQRELAKKNFQLEALNEQKNQFLGMAVHDLRGPLSNIIMYSQFLLDEVSEILDEESREFLSIIHSSSDFMLQMVDDLLDVAKIESGNLRLQLKAVDLREIVERNISLNRAIAAKKQIELCYYCDTDIPKLMVDENKIEQVLNNLTGNAIKFSYPDSKVEILLTRESKDAVISVKDEGKGIAPEEYGTIFEPFAHSSIRGIDGEKSSGLGLAISCRIIEGHNGKIWFESEVGIGSTFYFSLPISENEIKR
jgi:signal transduction histidine kinase